MKFRTTLNANEAIDLLSHYRSLNEYDREGRLFYSIVNSKYFVELIDQGADGSKSDKAKIGVLEILSLASGYKASDIQKSKRLRIDLKISPNIHSRLYRPFNRLLKMLGSHKVVKSKDVVACKKVDDCFKLIIKNL